MKRIVKFLSIFILAIIMLNLVGCNDGEEETAKEVKQETSNKSSNSHYPVTITTYNWNKEPVEITFEKAPEKVVAIYQSSIETLLALGQGDKIVAASFLDDPVKDEYKEAFDKIKYYEQLPTKEEILAMEADFITSWYSLFSEKNYGDVSFWHERGVNTYIQQNSGVKSPNSLENEYEDIINMGKIFDVEDKANQIVDDMKIKIKEAKESVKDKKLVKTVILESSKEGQYRIYGEDSIGGDIASQVGADLVVDRNDNIGVEDLIKSNPDVIFTVYYGDSIKSKEAVNNIMDNPALSSVPAIKNERVNPIVLSEVYASGVRTLDGINTIIDGLYNSQESK